MKPIKTKIGGKRAVFHGSWYRGENTNFLPAKKVMRDAEDGLAKFVLQGWMPDTPFIRRDQLITSFGSCFATHVTTFLDKQGFNVSLKDAKVENSYVIRFGEGLANTFAVRQQLEWGFGEQDFDDALWFGAQKEIAAPDPEVRRQTADLLSRTEVFIITLGVSEVWFDKQSGEVAWRAIPEQLFDENRHGFRVSTVEENRDNLGAIRDIILRHRPDAKIIFTLSPVPLMATFRDVSCISASSVSKAILRVAIDEFLRALPDEQDDTYYFPSYEAIMHFFREPFMEDNRHPKQKYVQKVLYHFLRFFCVQDEATSKPKASQ